MSELRKKLDTALTMEFYQKGMTDRQIGDALGVSIETVRKWRQRAGLVSHPPPRIVLSRLDVDGRGMELYQQGLSDLEIAEAFGLTRRTVRDWRERRGLKANKRPGRPRKTCSKPKEGPLFMTDAEILDSWRNAASWREQVKILAELNVCSVERMQRKLVELGCLQEVNS